MQPMITISSQAAEAIRESLSSPSLPSGYTLRVGIKGGACSAQYILGFDQPSLHDETHQIDQIPVLIDKRHLMYLIGVHIDFQITDGSAAFTITKG